MKAYQKFGSNNSIKKILFIAALYKDRSPGQRFRFEQYINYLEEKGFYCEFSCLVTEKTDKVFYSKGKLIRKLFLLIGFIIKRLKDVSKAKYFDVIFIQREAFFLGTTFFERQLAKRSKIVFDFDDSIWLSNVSEANKNLNFLKKASKTSHLIKLADLVFAGNKYLADYAAQFNNNIKIIPTTIDTSLVRELNNKNNDRICIGWSGSITTIQHFSFAIPFLELLYEKYKGKIKFKVIGDKNYANNKLDIQGIGWNKVTEVKDLSEFDIGIMPLPDDEWAKGKCGLKGLQYMALEIPTVMSPVGVNTEIINDGINGFLATRPEEWVEKLSMLIESPELRIKMGKEGRKTVVEKYSFDSQKDNYVKYFTELIEK